MQDWLYLYLLNWMSCTPTVTCIQTFVTDYMIGFGSMDIFIQKAGLSLWNLELAMSFELAPGRCSRRVRAVMWIDGLSQCQVIS